MRAGTLALTWTRSLRWGRSRSPGVTAGGGWGGVWQELRSQTTHASGVGVGGAAGPLDPHSTPRPAARPS